MAGDNSAFLLEQQKALERMMEMSKRSQGAASPHKRPPAPSFVKLGNDNRIQAEEKRKEETPMEEKKTPPPINTAQRGIIPSLSNLQLPFLSGLKKDSDMTLILGLILILMSEKSDRLLMLALLYILL